MGNTIKVESVGFIGWKTRIILGICVLALMLCAPAWSLDSRKAFGFAEEIAINTMNNKNDESKEERGMLFQSSYNGVIMGCESTSVVASDKESTSIFEFQKCGKVGAVEHTATHAPIILGPAVLKEFEKNKIRFLRNCGENGSAIMNKKGITFICSLDRFARDYNGKVVAMQGTRFVSKTLF